MLTLAKWLRLARARVFAPQADSAEGVELGLTLNSLSGELHKLDDIHWICPLMQCVEEVSARL